MKTIPEDINCWHSLLLVDEYNLLVWGTEGIPSFLFESYSVQWMFFSFSHFHVVFPSTIFHTNLFLPLYRFASFSFILIRQIQNG